MKSKFNFNKKIFLEGTVEELELLQTLFDSGELSDLLGFSVIDAGFITGDSKQSVTENSVAEENSSGMLRRWFQRISSLWGEYEPVLLGTYYAINALNPLIKERNALEAAIAKSIQNLQPGLTSEIKNHNLLFVLRNKQQEFYLRFISAIELVEESSKSSDNSEIIESLANLLPDSTIDQETESREHLILNWQIALSLGQLDPNHPKAAVARHKECEITQDLLVDLVVAIRNREDGNIDIFLQVYSSDNQFLNSGIKLVVLDEYGEKIPINAEEYSFLEVQSGNEDSEISLSLFSSTDKHFSVKISWEDFSTVEKFII